MLSQVSNCATQGPVSDVGVLFAFAMIFIGLGVPIGIVELELAIRHKLIARGWNIRPC